MQSESLTQWQPFWLTLQSAWFETLCEVPITRIHFHESPCSRFPPLNGSYYFRFIAPHSFTSLRVMKPYNQHSVSKYIECNYYLSFLVHRSSTVLISCKFFTNGSLLPSLYKPRDLIRRFHNWIHVHSSVIVLYSHSHIGIVQHCYVFHDCGHWACYEIKPSFKWWLIALKYLGFLGRLENRSLLFAPCKQ